MKNILALCISFCLLTNVIAQIAVNTDGSAANASAMLDVKSSNKGVLIPRISTAQRNAIVSPAPGLFVFDSTERTLYMFDGIQWLGFAALNDQQRPVNNFITAPTKQDTTLAGYSVSMWDQFAAIGAPYTTINGTLYSGAVYIYHFNGSTWQYFTTLSSTTTAGALLGISVSLKGNYLIAGAPGQQDASSSPVGAAYVYYYNGTSWGLLQTIFGSTPSIGFGNVVNINQFGNYAAISAPQATVSAVNNAGMVNIYFNSGASLALEQSISDPSPVDGEYFGTAMAINPGGNNIIVGAPSKTVGSYTGDGYVGQFDRSGGTWSQTHNYTPPPDNNQAIGQQVDINDSYVIFSVGKTKTVDYLSLDWSGYNISIPDNINSIALDPTSNNVFVFAGSSIYEANNGTTATQVKNIAISNTNFFVTQLIGAYNKKYVAGIPTSAIPAQPYEGVYIFGTGPY